jgi:predicted nucleic acid-binding protein
MSEDAAKVYLDTNVFIAAYESTGARSEHAFWILAAIEQGEIRGVTSELTLAELIPGPAEDGDDALVEAYKQLMNDGPNMEVRPVTRDMLIQSALLRVGRPGLKLPDAIHCATAMHAGCTAIITDDRRMPKNVGLRVVAFGPHALSDVQTVN